MSTPPAATLTILSGAQAGLTFTLTSTDMMIGRSSTCDICIPDPSVSRRHARLRYSGGQWFIQDQGSSSGTTVNGQPTQATRLQSGDVISLGRCDVRFNG